MKRHPDWPSRLADHIRAASGRPFSWGSHDCCLFAADGVKTMTGVDPAAAFRGRYRTKRGAFAALKRFCGGGIATAAERIARELGCEEVAPITARRGDVVLTDQGEWLALGICCGAKIAVVGMEGVERQPLTKAIRAWRIG